MSDMNRNRPEVWAIGGGKGGTGKSFIASNIATYLAQQGKRTVLIDADFGGANLHTLLGVPKPKQTITDFFRKKIPLDQLIVSCKVPNLGLIVGPIRSFEPDSIKYVQKVKLLNHVKKIDADIVLMDLGAGTHFNIVDTFLLADKKIVVTLPQITAMENMYSFLKNSFFRRLVRAFIENRLKYVMDEVIKNRQEYELGNMQQFVAFLKTISEPAKQIVEKELASYRINIIINQARNNRDITLGNAIKSVCIKYLGFHANCVGYIEQDDTIPLALNKQQPYLQIYPKSRCAAKIERIADNLINDKQMRVQL